MIAKACGETFNILYLLHEYEVCYSKNGSAVYAADIVSQDAMRIIFRQRSLHLQVLHFNKYLRSFVSSFGVKMLKRNEKINFSSSRLELQPSRTIANEQAEQRPRWVRGGRGRGDAQTDHQEPPQHARWHGG